MADVDPQARQQLAADAFNETWRYLDKSSRDAEDEARMLYLAHLSRDQWGVVGRPVHWARGEWQLSRVYSAVGKPEIALEHARRYMQICDQNSLGDFDIAAAHEAFVRAYRVCGDMDRARDEYFSAMTYAAQVVEPEDRAVLFADLREHACALGIPWDQTPEGSPRR